MIFEFGDFELDESLFELRRSGKRLAVQPKVLRLILHLVQNRHRVVSAKELRQTLWPDQVVVGKSSLDRAVHGARRALGDDGTTQTVVRTVNRHGYHFAAPATHRRDPSAHSAASADALSSASRETLTVAAAIGYEFSLPLLTAVTAASPAATCAALDEAVAVDLVCPSPGASDRFAFVSPALRDTLRAELSNAQHEALTRRIAFALVQWHERERSKAS